MTTISGICRDAAGNPVAGRLVRVYRMDTGRIIGWGLSGDGSTPVKTYRGWDTSRTFTYVTYSEDGKRAALGYGAVTTRVALALDGHTSGKRYFEIFGIASGNTLAMGIAKSTSLGTYLGGNADGYAFWDGYVTGNNERLYNNGTERGFSNVVDVRNGLTVGVAFDGNSGKLWFSRNGAWIEGDPAAGTGQSYSFTPGATFKPAADLYGFNSGTAYSSVFAELRTDPNELAYAAPSGFEAGWPLVGSALDLGEYSIDCGSYADEVVVYEFDPADMTIAPKVHISTPV